MGGTAEILLGLALGYLAGSIPFGLLLTRAAGAGDIRAIGSGNIGATNVLRTGRKDLAALTLVLDALKATVPILIARNVLGPDAALAVAAGAFIGHCFPVWLGFKGGKGVATFVGCLLGLDWRSAVVFALVWLAIAAVTRFSSLAGLSACFIAALVPWWFGDARATVVLLLLVAIVAVRHRANISRLLAGTESRIGGSR